MKIIIAAMLALLVTACGSTNGIPDGAVAWCGQFEYTGTWIKAQSDGRALGVSDAQIAQRLSVDDVIQLAQAMGCAQS